MKLHTIPILFITVLVSAITGYQTSPGEQPAPCPTDADRCSVLMSQSLSKLLAEASLASVPPEPTARIRFSQGLQLSEGARMNAEAIITKHGFLLSDGARSVQPDYTMDIAVTDVSIVVRQTGDPKDTFERTVSVTVHLRVTRQSGDNRTVVYASGATETTTDILPKDNSRHSDNVYLFCPEAVRTTLRKSRTGTMAVTLLLISGALLYFSSR